MQRLHNINKWFEVGMGKSIHFGNPNPRPVRLDVNAPVATALYYVDGNGEMTFLARVEGRDVIEFTTYGEFSISVDDDKLVSIYTIDGEDLSFRIPDAVKLTKLAERRARNPEIEMMQYQMNRNIQERLNAVRDEMERTFNQRLQAIAADAKKPEASGDGGSVPAKPASDKPADAGSGNQSADTGTGADGNK